MVFLRQVSWSTQNSFKYRFLEAIRRFEVIFVIYSEQSQISGNHYSLRMDAMEWNGTKRNGMEPNGMEPNGKESNGTEPNGMEPWWRNMMSNDHIFENMIDFETSWISSKFSTIQPKSDFLPILQGCWLPINYLWGCEDHHDGAIWCRPIIFSKIWLILKQIEFLQNSQ